jgi:hypothetical protein
MLSKESVQTAYSSETSDSTYKITWWHNPQDHNINNTQLVTNRMVGDVFCTVSY